MISRPTQQQHDITTHPTAMWSEFVVNLQNIWTSLRPTWREAIFSWHFTQQDEISALAVDYIQLSTLKISRAFGCKGFLSPNHSRGKSFIDIAIIYTCVRPQDPSSRSFLAAVKIYLSPSSLHGWGVTRSLCHIIFIVHVRSFWLWRLSLTPQSEWEITRSSCHII